MSADKLKALLKNDDLDYEEDLIIAEDGDWIDEGKYAYREYIADITYGNEEGIDPGYYRVNMSRSGSYYSEYEYYIDAVTKVVPYDEIVTVVKWRPA